MFDRPARYGLCVADAQSVVMSAIGGRKNVATTNQGRAHDLVNVRCASELPDNIERFSQVLAAPPGGAQISTSRVAETKQRRTPEEYDFVRSKINLPRVSR